MSLSPIQTLPGKVSNKDTWSPNFFEFSPFYEKLKPLWQLPSCHTWPSLSQYQSQYLTTMSHLPCWERVKFIDQEHMRDGIRYESHIYNHREVPTRPHCWHDFFNYLTWMQWPKSKLALNQKMMHEYFKWPQHKMIHRTAVQNRLALLDECGLVIVAPSEVLSWIRQHNWITLFHQHKDLFHSQIRVYVFGHGLYEKCLNPYVGMTGHAWLCSEPVADEEVDNLFAKWLRQEQSLTQKSELAPFPMLGVPGAWANQSLAFYHNTDYFRPKTSRISSRVKDERK